MSTESLHTGPRPASPSATVVKYDQYVDTRISQTRRTVRTVELASALVALVAGVLAYLLTVTLVEQWLLPGGFGVVGRSVLFALLVGGAAYYVYRRVWPLCVRRINPVYAAQTIEQGNPSLKNSLINLLLFRQRRGELTTAVYETLEEQAAQRLTRVSTDTTVDRTHLIRLGYVLVAVVAAAVLYKAFSPKDPLITAERVLMPWADVVPASRVSITAVEPGTTTVARGEYVRFSADVYGLRDDDTVVVRYTTDDGQAVDKAVPMSSADDGPHFECRLPGEGESGAAVGVTQNLRYRIEAGDARSHEYRVTVVAAPTILVRSVDYDYPDYTGYADRHVDDLGDLRAIEGTRVTIHARANGPIDDAYVDFDVDGRRDVQMTADGSDAEASFTLALRPDRRTPEHTSYALRFTNTEGRPNRQPVKHPIDVLRDYAPEVELTEPTQRTLDVRLDETVPIGVEARDPDFALSAVQLQGEVAGRQAFDVPLLSADHQGRFTDRYNFTPKRHGLKAGDVVKYWIVAQDNRTPEANSTTTDWKLLRITSPNPAQEPRQPGQQRQGQQQGAGQPDQQQGGQEGEQQPQQGQRQDGQQGQQSQQQDGQQGQQQGAGKQGEQPQQPTGGQQGQGQAQQGGARNEGQQQNDSNAAGGAGQQAQSSREGRQDQPREGQSSPVADGQRNQSSGQREHTGGDNNRSDVPSDAQPGEGSDEASPNAEPAPISSEGDNDAEAFDRIRQHLRQNGELNDQGQQPSADNAQRQPDRDGQEPFSREAQSSADGQPLNRQSPEQSSREAQPRAKDHQQPARPTGEKPGEGQGAEKPSGDARSGAKEPADRPDQSPAPDGEQTRSEGPSGGGDQPDASQAPPGSQQDTEPIDKWQQRPSADEPPRGQDEPPAGRGQRKSDTPGDGGSDRVGEGAERGPSPTERDGTGSSGQNQSADEGAGESSEQGAGNNSPDAGGDAPANHQTGQPGSNTPGAGSSQRDGAGHEPGGQPGADDARQQPSNQSRQQSGGNQNDTGMNGQPQSGDGDSQQPGGDSQQGPFSRHAQQSADDAQRGVDGGHDHGRLPGQNGQSTDNQRAPGEAGQPGENSPPPNQPGDQPGSGVGAPTGGGGQTGTGNVSPPQTSGSAPEGDDANLEYARKQTDLVLERLSEQLKQHKVDQQLLDQLGWSEDDLRKFVSRWQERFKAAESDAPAADPARRELDEALRSLGLRRGPLRQADQRQDQMRDLEQGYRGSVPLEYRERLRAYSEGVSRARQAEE